MVKIVKLCIFYHNFIKCLHSTFYMPDTVLTLLQISTHLIPNINPMRQVLLFLPWSSLLSLPRVHSWQVAQPRCTGWRSSSITSPFTILHSCFQQVRLLAWGSHPSIHSETEQHTLLLTHHGKGPKTPDYPGLTVVHLGISRGLST